MTALIIVGVLLLLVLLILFLPVSVILNAEKQFSVKIKMAGIKLFEFNSDNPPKKEKLPKKEKGEKKRSDKKKTEPKSTNIFVKIKKEQGFVAAVKVGADLAGRFLKQIKGFLKHISVEKVKLGITVASNDAAKTAIEYGVVCQAVYPVTAALNDFAKVKFREINITSDFVAEKPSFRFGATVKLQIFYLLATAIKLYKEWKNFLTEMDKNERTK